MNPFTWCSSLFLYAMDEPRASRLVFFMAVGGALFWVVEGVLAALRERRRV